MFGIITQIQTILNLGTIPNFRNHWGIFGTIPRFRNFFTHGGSYAFWARIVFLEPYIFFQCANACPALFKRVLFAYLGLKPRFTMASPTSLLKTALTCEAFNISCVRQLSRFHLRRLASLMMDTRTNPEHRKNKEHNLI